MTGRLLVTCLRALTLGAALTGCARNTSLQGNGSDAGADPAIGHRAAIGLSSATAEATSSAAPPVSEHPTTPTAEEAAQTSIPRFVALVPNATTSSTLRCPPGTVLSRRETSMSCSLRDPKNPFRALQGPSLTFHANGKLSSQGHYADGQETGHWWFFGEDGTLDHEVDFVAGEYDGLYVSYWPNGARRGEQGVKSGKRDGIAKRWDQHGALSEWSLYESGRLLRTRIFH